MTFVLLGYERGGKYMWYKKDVDISGTRSRKCECPFRLRDKLVKGGQWWMVELICGSHNYDLEEIMGRSSVYWKVKCRGKDYGGGYD